MDHVRLSWPEWCNRGRSLLRKVRSCRLENWKWHRPYGIAATGRTIRSRGGPFLLLIWWLRFRNLRPADAPPVVRLRARDSLAPRDASRGSCLKRTVAGATRFTRAGPGESV